MAESKPRATAAKKSVTAKKTAAAKAPAKTAARSTAVKVAAKKDVAAMEKKPVSRTAASKIIITPEQRYRMICDAAYFKAERRGFVGGNPADDWVEAEAEIDRLLKKSHSGSQSKH